MGVSISPSYMRKPVYDVDADDIVDVVERARRGTAFPDNPTNGYLFFREDLDGLYVYVE